MHRDYFSASLKGVILMASSLGIIPADTDPNLIVELVEH